MHNLRFLCASASIAALALPLQAQSVSGRILSTEHDEPIAGAVITLRGQDGAEPQIYIAQTGGDGRFSVTSVAPGTYAASASKAGFGLLTSSRIPSPQDARLVHVEPGAPATVEIRLVPDGVIAGRITDADGDPMRRVAIRLERYGYQQGKKQLRVMQTANTNDLGEYRIFDLPPGKYFLYAEPAAKTTPVLRRASAPNEVIENDALRTGPAPAYYSGVPDAAHAAEIEVAPGAEIDGIDLRLTPQRLYSIRGHVALEDPMERVNVYAINRSPEARRGAAPVNLQGGDYTVSRLPSGSYTVVAQVFHAPPQQGVAKSGRVSVEIAGSDLDHVDIALEPRKPIRGVVKVEGGTTAPLLAGSPVQTTNVTFSSEDPNIGGNGVRVDADGSFRADLEQGVYRVNLGGRWYLKSVLVGKDALPDKKIDTAHLSGDITLIAASDFGTVEGVVTDADAKPIYNALVTLLGPADDERQPSVYTKPDGKFNIQNVVPGVYKAFAWVGVEFGAPQDPDFRKPFEDRAVSVNVDSNGHPTVELKAIQPQ